MRTAPCLLRRASSSLAWARCGTDYDGQCSNAVYLWSCSGQDVLVLPLQARWRRVLWSSSEVWFSGEALGRITYPGLVRRPLFAPPLHLRVRRVCGPAHAASPADAEPASLVFRRRRMKCRLEAFGCRTCLACGPSSCSYVGVSLFGLAILLFLLRVVGLVRPEVRSVVSLPE